MPGLGGLFGTISADANGILMEQPELGAQDSGYFVWPMAAVSQALRDCTKGVC